jgi:DNA adenine methylase
MQYLGGKSKIRKQISAFLESVRKPNQTYFEPFVGGAWVLQEMSGNRIASDGNKALVAMYKALQNGWIPPTFVSEEEYQLIKKVNDPTDPMTIFCGIGCSFAGKLWGGYARSEGKTCYAKISHNSLMKQLPKIKDVQFVDGLFQDHAPKDMLVYCDPPYQGTTQYGAFSGFDYELFWNKMREWSKYNTVVVSEYNAPADFKCVAEFYSQMGMTTGNERPKRTEKLFMSNGI